MTAFFTALLRLRFGARLALPSVWLCVGLLCLSACQTEAEKAAANLAEAQEINTKAMEKLDDNDLEAASTLLEEAVRVAPMYGEAWNNLGAVQLRQHALQPAARALSRACELMPGNAHPHNNLGLVYEYAGILERAETYYQKARQLAPDNLEIAGNLARTRVRRNENTADLRELLAHLMQHDLRLDWQDWAREQHARLSDQAQGDQVPAELDQHKKGSESDK